jgi:hypothetical protein
LKNFYKEKKTTLKKELLSPSLEKFYQPRTMKFEKKIFEYQIIIYVFLKIAKNSSYQNQFLWYPDNNQELYHQ